ncbi:MAG: formylglycine-generating enzyme family protein [Calditrichaeota bacterium]|nr:formylglycine-generating enzyme family protein [Calditrichota bacterium]
MNMCNQSRSKIFFIIFITLVACSKKPEFFINSIGMKMIRIEAGTFRMGDLSGKGQWDERPVHQVTISQPFYISEREVTIEQFRKFRPDYEGNERYAPYVTGISWHEASEFCRWLSGKEGKTYRLPTEAEWEYVCRAGTETPYSSGQQPPAPGKANPWGVRNMHTGVLEWCYDWYGPYSDEPQTNPVGAEQGFARVVRGGLPDTLTKKFEHPEIFYARSANRAGIAPGFSGLVPDIKLSPPVIPDSEKTPAFRGLVGVYYDSDHL